MAKEIRNSVCALIAAAVGGGKSYERLAEASGMSVNAVWHWVKALRKQGLVYVSGWAQDSGGRATVMLFTFGQGEDVKRPAKTAVQRVQEWRSRQKGKVSE